MSLDGSDWSALLTTFKLAVATTLTLLLLGSPLAWWLARSRWKFKFVIEAMVALPLILPPTVLGFYLLVAMGPDGPLGYLAQTFGMKTFAFTFTGLVIGSVFYSMPFVVQPLQDSFRAMGERPLEVAATLGLSPWKSFWRVVIPLAKPGFLTATVLGFAHTVGEFGVVLMIGGNIPGSTQVVSIAIYDHVETLQYDNAHVMSGILLGVSFLMLVGVYLFNRRFAVMRT